MRKLPRPDAIFFDWDDTIFTNTFYAKETLTKMVKRHPTKLAASVFPTNPEVSLIQSVHNRFSAMAGVPLEQIMSNMFKGDVQYFVAEFRRQYAFAKQKHGIRFLDGAVKTLQTIKSMGIPMALISNKKGDSIRAEVKDAKLDSMFFTVIGEGDFSDSKPSPVQVIEAVKILTKQTGKKVDLSTCFMIGDAITDILCGKNAGCVPIHIGEITYLPRDIQNDCINGNIISVENHKELQNLLNTIKQKNVASATKNGSTLASLHNLKRAANK